MVEQLSKDQSYISPFAEKFIGYMGEDLNSLDFNSNIEKFSHEVKLYPEMSNHQIVLSCLREQLGINDSMNDQWRADPDSEPNSGLYNTSKYSYEDINERIALETPNSIMKALEEVDISKDIKAIELGLEGKDHQSIESFVELVEKNIKTNLPVEEFRSELLAYAVVSSLEDKYRHIINKRLYLSQCSAKQALSSVLE